MNKQILLCFSSGGHFTQMQELISSLSENSFIIISEQAPDIIEFTKNTDIKVLLLPKVVSNRFIFLISNIPYLFHIFHIVNKSNLFISTGGITSVIPGIISFLCRKKIIFIETIAKHNDLTITGKIFYMIADKFYVQSQNLAKIYKKSIYVGTLYRL